MNVIQAIWKNIFGSIQIKLGLTLLLVTSLILSGFGAYNYFLARANYQNDLNKQAKSLATRLSQNLSVPIWNLDWQSVEISIESEMSDRNVFSIIVKDATSRNIIGRTRDSNWKIVPTFKQDPDNLIICSLPITFKEQILGDVHVYITTSLMQSDLNSVIIKLLSAFVVLSIVLLLTLFVALRLGLISPILETKTILEKIGQGDFLEMLPARLMARTDEIGILMQAISRMQTDLKEKIAALGDSQKQYATIFDSSPSAIALRNYSNDEYKEVNKSFQTMFGYSPEQVIGWTPLDLGLFIEPLKYYQFMQRLRQSLSINGFEYRFRRKDDTEGLALDSAVIIVLKDTAHILSISYDITNLRRVEEEANRLSTAMESVGDAVIITDLAFKISYINPSCEKTFGVCREDVVGNVPDLYFFGDPPSVFRDRIQDASQRHKIWNGPITFLLKTGQQIHSDTTISPIVTPGNKFLGCVSVIRDQSENRRLEAEVRRSQKMEAIGTLAGGVAHEFRNILTIIVGGLQIAQIKYANVRSVFEELGRFAYRAMQEVGALDTNRESFFELLEAATNILNKYDKSISTYSTIGDSLGRAMIASRRATDLISQMLTFSRQSEQNLKLVEPNTIFSEAMKLLRPTTPSTINFAFSPAGEKMVIYSDPTQLQQILINLTNNAVQAIHDRTGEIIIKTEKETMAAGRIFNLPAGEYFKLTVSDNGPGIPPEIIDKIFDPFFTTKPKEQGTGLGLSVVHGIVQNHRGAVEVKSSVGLGTTFYLYFPLATSSLGFGSDQRETMPAVSKGSIVLVDDEKEIIANLAPLLVDCGHTVQAFTLPESALLHIAENPDNVDILLADFAMPDMTGLELIKKVKSIRPEIGCLLGTGSTSPGIQKKADLVGADRFLEKPYLIAELSQIIQEVLSRSNQSEKGAQKRTQ